jgi:ssDNA thymidine ADP-ribosyltransferase, DarT
MPTSIYHITHIQNLQSILRSGGLVAHSRLKQQGIDPLDISYEQIQDRRATKKVPCSMGGVLHDYVPFYFAPRSPVLYTIQRGNLPNCPEGQTSILHLVTTAEAIQAASLAFTFTDGHAIMEYSDFYEEIAALNNVIDWSVMRSRYWNDTEDDPNRKCRRQAEFLIHGFLPWQVITEIGVINQEMRKQVCQVLQTFDHSLSVSIYPSWYY